MRRRDHLTGLCTEIFLGMTSVLLLFRRQTATPSRFRDCHCFNGILSIFFGVVRSAWWGFHVWSCRLLPEEDFLLW